MASELEIWLYLFGSPPHPPKPPGQGSGTGETSHALVFVLFCFVFCFVSPHRLWWNLIFWGFFVLFRFVNLRNWRFNLTCLLGVTGTDANPGEMAATNIGLDLCNKQTNNKQTNKQKTNFTEETQCLPQLCSETLRHVHVSWRSGEDRPLSVRSGGQTTSERGCGGCAGLDGTVWK